ncbi:MAG: sigma-70 family RNA polymerase sigma factor [Pyrinomonadaceae bacterium]
MYMEDDPKEKNVRLAADMQFAEEQIAAKSVTPLSLVEKTATAPELGDLFKDHHKGIFRVAYRITGNQGDAEDVLQTIFVRLTRGWSERDLSPNPRAFLYRAAINASLDIVRLRKRANSVPLELVDLDRTASSSVASPADALADTELSDLIRQAVAKLEGRSAAAFALRYFEGYDNRQIAEVLGTSQMVVAVTLHRARTRLRKEIGNYLEKHHEAQ